jgi:hypothetical protein
MADPTIDDNKQYRVKVNRPVQIFEHTTITPVTENVVSGSVLRTIPEEAIVSFEQA